MLCCYVTLGQAGSPPPPPGEQEERPRALTTCLQPHCSDSAEEGWIGPILQMRRMEAQGQEVVGDLGGDDADPEARFEV